MGNEADTLTGPFTIRGVPYCKLKRRGKVAACKSWLAAIEEQTSSFEPIEIPCELEVEFLLPPDEFPADLPFGPDLDNLLELFMDGLQKHVIANDSLVVRVVASKRSVKAVEAGAVFTLRPPVWAVTQELNRSLEGEASPLDAQLASMQRRTLQKDPW